MKLNKKRLEQLKKQSLLQNLVKVFSFKLGEPVTYQEFDTTPETEKTIGVNVKRFVRCNPRSMPNFIESIQYKNAYIVPSADIIKEGIIPANVSVIVKRDIIKFVVKEVIGSQVLSWFGVNTCFNSAVKNIQNYDMISVDMIGENEKLFAFYELKPINSWGVCERQLEIIKDMLSDKNLAQHKIFLDNNQKDELINDFVYSQLVRKVLLYDDDFGTRNCGILYNKKAMTARLVNFDYEYVADPKGDSRYNVMKDIEYISQQYPELYGKFCRKAKQILLVRRPLYANLKNYPKDTAEYLKEIFDKVYDSLGKIHTYNRAHKIMVDDRKEMVRKVQGVYTKQL